ncbi:acyl-CoA dehydrogenase family member 10-like [Littorina saxatilis]|uniref:Acyl-CoA dehydrogenase n=1 Tax=Littorina saxatilis TaxID=31220 RepID=A0AAN9FXY4_9CAEN
MSSGSKADALMTVSVEGLSPRAKEIHSKVVAFIRQHIQPLEDDILRKKSDSKYISAKIKDLQSKARQQGLWNLFLPLESDPGMKFGAGLSNVEYALICEEMGKCPISPAAFNCNAPDTGNMEVLVRYGTEEQKRTWLMPLLDAKIGSCFGMTEPAVASSDATNIQASIRREGNEYIVNGHKWWTSGAMDPDCKLCVFMGKTDSSAPRHKQQTMILVPMDAPGVKVVRPLSVFGFLDEPGGHAEVTFTNVRVPVTNVLLGEGRGFEIAQGRLGPGRIHHCMRLIGNAERALELMLQRTMDRVAFGKPLAALGTIQANVAQSRLEIEQARLLVLKAAHKMDHYGNRVAAPEIAMIKVVTPNMALNVIDRAIQAFGGAGVSNDFPLAAMFAGARTLRLADGPDEVHLRTVARIEYGRHHRRQQAKL